MPDQIGLHVVSWMDDRVSHAWLTAKVNDAIEPFLGHRRLKRLVVYETDMMKFKCRFTSGAQHWRRARLSSAEP